MTDPFALITDRQREVADEINDLTSRISSLKQEMKQLDETLAFVTALANRTPPDKNDDALVNAAPETTGKPADLAPVTDLIANALRQAHGVGSPGLQPHGLVSWVRGHGWPNAEVANIGPIAWRMWKRGQLGKDGPLYYLLDREKFYPASAETETSTAKAEDVSEAGVAEGLQTPHDIFA